MTESKVSQSNKDNRFPEVKAKAPTDVTPYIQPVIGQLGWDTKKPGLFGLGASPDNGATFHVFATFDGLVIDDDDIKNQIWPGTVHKVQDEIDKVTADIPAARSAAESAVKFAESAIAASKVNSDAIVAQSSAVVEAKSAMDSATAEIQQLKANAASDVAQIESTIAEVQAGVNQAKSANESAVQAVQAELKSTSDSMDKVEKRLNEVGTDLDTYAKSAAEQGNDITLIKQKQGQFEADFASAQGNVNQIQADIKGLRQNIKDNQGNIASLLTSADKLQASMTDAEKNISNLLLTASKYEQTFKDQDGRLSKVEQTAAEHTSVLADAKGNIDKVTQKADNLQLLLSNAQKNIQKIQLDAKGLHDTLTGQGNQLASLNVTLNNLDSKYSGITGDLQSKQTALSTEQQQTKDMLLNKADKSEVDNVKGTVNQVSAEQKVMADQINQKVSSTEYQTLKDKVNGLRIGGRNLLSNSETDIVIESNTTDPWPAWKYKVVYWNLTPNVQYTFSTSATNTNGVKEASMRIFNKSVNKEVGNANFVFPADGKRHSKTFGVPDDGTQYSVYLYAGHMGNIEGKNFVTTYHHPQLEMGNVESDYSPNPDDTIASIQKNTTAIDENSKLISLTAKQTDVDKIKGTAQQLSSRLDVMADQIKSKVTSTDVNNIVDGKGYATTSTVQSLITQKAGTINESITNLDAKYKDKDGVNLATKTGNVSLSGGYNSNKNIGYISLDAINDLCGKYMTVSVDVEWSGWKSGNQNRIGYELQINYDDGSTDYDGCWLTPTTANGKQRVTATYEIKDQHVQSLGEGNAYIQINCTSAKVSHLKIERGTVATPWTPAPIDNATVTQIQSITASIDGLQSNVTNYQNNTSSKYTQLSNLMQSKVGTADFEQLKRSVDMQTLDSADINNMKTSGHYFVHSLTGNPVGGWVYVDVTGNGNDRIRQDVYQDSGLKHKYRRWFGTYWTGWEEGATYTEITQLQDAINLRVQKGELLSQINLTAGNTLIQTGKLYLDSSSVVFSGRAFIPSAAISELDADKLTFYGNGSKASIGAGIAQYDQDRLKSTINLQYNGGFEIHSSNNLGSILTMHDDTIRLASKSQIYGSGSGRPIDQQYSGVWFGKNYALLNAVDNEGETTGWSIGPSNKNGYRAWLYDSSKSIQPNYGVGIGTTRFDVYAGDSQIYTGPDKAEIRGSEHATVHGGIQTYLEGGNQQLYLHNGEIIANNMSGNTATGVHLIVHGWATYDGYVEGMGWTTKSTLSSKTRIEKLDTKDALNKIMNTDLETFQYKAEVAEGMTKRHAGLIIDDVHDVAQYNTPDEFINERRTGRSDADVIGYLMGAVQEQQKQIEQLKEKITNG